MNSGSGKRKLTNCSSRKSVTSKPERTKKPTPLKSKTKTGNTWTNYDSDNLIKLSLSKLLTGNSRLGHWSVASKNWVGHLKNRRKSRSKKLAKWTSKFERLKID